MNISVKMPNSQILFFDVYYDQFIQELKKQISETEGIYFDSQIIKVLGKQLDN